MAGGNGPWGGGNGPEDDKGRKADPRGNDRRGGGPQIPELDQVIRKGQERLRVIMGGGGSGGRGNGSGPGGDGNWFFTRQGLISAVIALGLIWSYLSFYQVKPEEKSVELLLGKFYQVKNDGLNLAPWPFVSAEIVNTSQQRTTDIGTGTGGELDNGLMLTGDQNIVDIEFQVVWNVNDPAKFLFNLKEPEDTIRAVAESAVRDIVARSQLAPILNKNRGEVEDALMQEVQSTMDSYNSGITVVRVNLLKSDVPAEVADSFRAVQAAQQERDRLQKVANAYANQVTAAARGQASQTAQEAQAYAAQVVNQAEGDASRFLSVYAEYAKAPEVTRKRMYLETMEQVLGGANKVIMDGQASTGAVPYLPLNTLFSTAKPAASKPAAPATATAPTGGNN
ncbi:FtsH protease activity modulator HflK [bacterium]|nr:FtsH protease activity modulator HflK [bacterium]